MDNEWNITINCPLGQNRHVKIKTATSRLTQVSVYLITYFIVKVFISPESKHRCHTHLPKVDPVAVVVVEGAVQVSRELVLVNVLQQGF